MAFNFKKGAQTALMGWRTDYSDQLKQQREFERQQRLQDVQMMKQKELAMWQNQQNKQTEQEQYALDRSRKEDDARAQGLEEGTEAYNNFVYGKRELTEEEQIALAKKKGVASAEGQMEIQDKARAAEVKRIQESSLPDDVKKQRINEVMAGYKKPTTAADANADKIAEIIGDKQAKDLTFKDKAQLAAYGVKVPGMSETKLTGENLTKLQLETTKMAKEEVAAMKDNEVLMMAKQLSIPADTAQEARTKLATVVARMHYANAVKTIQGGMMNQGPGEAKPEPKPTLAPDDTMMPLPEPSALQGALSTPVQGRTQGGVKLPMSSGVTGRGTRKKLGPQEEQDMETQGMLGSGYTGRRGRNR